MTVIRRKRDPGHGGARWQHHSASSWGLKIPWLASSSPARKPGMTPKVYRELRRRPAVEPHRPKPSRHGAATMFGPSRRRCQRRPRRRRLHRVPFPLHPLAQILLRQIVIALLQRFNPFQSEILCARLQRLFDDANLVVLRPASSPLNPAQNLEPASPDDLKVRLKVTCTSPDVPLEQDCPRRMSTA